MNNQPVKRVLVCDDEKPIAKLLQMSLEKQGYEVFVAYDGREALKLIDEKHVDVIVLDWLMPYVDGLEVLQRVKANPDLSDLKVIMLSTLAQDEDIAEGRKQGADHYMTKPFNPTELYTMIRDL